MILTANVPVIRAHHIKLTYSGHGKHTATWKTNTGATIRRVIQLDQCNSHDTDIAALQAAQHYANWTNTLNEERNVSYTNFVSLVTLCYLGPDKHSIAVNITSKALSA